MYLESGMLRLERILESYQPMHSHYRWEAQVQGRMVISTRSQSKLGKKQACISLFNLFLIRGQLLYNVVLVSAIHWHESAMRIHTSPPLWMSLPTPTPPSIYHRALGMSSLHHTANSYWLSALYMIKHRFQLKHVFLQPWFRVPSGSLDCQHLADGIFALIGMSQSIWPSACNRAVFNKHWQSGLQKRRRVFPEAPNTAYTFS